MKLHGGSDRLVTPQQVVGILREVLGRARPGRLTDRWALPPPGAPPDAQRPPVSSNVGAMSQTTRLATRLVPGARRRRDRRRSRVARTRRPLHEAAGDKTDAVPGLGSPPSQAVAMNMSATWLAMPAYANLRCCGSYASDVLESSGLRSRRASQRMAVRSDRRTVPGRGGVLATLPPDERARGHRRARGGHRSAHARRRTPARRHAGPLHLERGHGRLHGRRLRADHPRATSRAHRLLEPLREQGGEGGRHGRPHRAASTSPRPSWARRRSSLLLAMRRTRIKLYAMATALVVVSAIVAVLGLPGVAVVGDIAPIPRGFPHAATAGHVPRPRPDASGALAGDHRIGPGRGHQPCRAQRRRQPRRPESRLRRPGSRQHRRRRVRG